MVRLRDGGADFDTPASHTCPRCHHWPIDNWKRGELAGTFCNKCGWWNKDKRHVPHAFRCICGRDRGDVWLFDTMKKQAVEDLLKYRYRCDLCSACWLSRGRNPRAHVLVRYEGRCMCGCGKQLVWQDFKETVPLDFVTWKTGLWIDPDCMRAGREPGIDSQMKKIWAAGGRGHVAIKG
jgi:hypothetical protein